MTNWYPIRSINDLLLLPSNELQYSFNFYIAENQTYYVYDPLASSGDLQPYDHSGSTGWWIMTSSAASASLTPEVVDNFVPVNNQTTFALSSTISPFRKPKLEVGGLLQRQNTDYIILGNILSWISQDFSLTPAHPMRIYY